jgi:hypothetical protein
VTSSKKQIDFPTPQWIKPINEIAGRDHLGAQAISVNLYGQLLPEELPVNQYLREEGVPLVNKYASMKAEIKELQGQQLSDEQILFRLGFPAVRTDLCHRFYFLGANKAFFIASF